MIFVFFFLFFYQDTVTGFLLAGVGGVDAKRQPNVLVVDNGMFLKFVFQLKKITFSRFCFYVENVNVFFHLFFNGILLILFLTNKSIQKIQNNPI